MYYLTNLLNGVNISLCENPILNSLNKQMLLMERILNIRQVQAAKKKLWRKQRRNMLLYIQYHRGKELIECIDVEIELIFNARKLVY